MNRPWLFVCAEGEAIELDLQRGFCTDTSALGSGEFRAPAAFADPRSAHFWGRLSFASSYEPAGGFGSGPYTRYTTPVLNGCDESSLK